MIKTIKAGKHRAKPITFGLWWDKRIIKHSITFTKSCAYIIDKEDDINKLFGLGYVRGLHHTDSARFAWRYSPTNDKIEILSYCYVRKQRLWNHLCYVDFDKEYLYMIIVRSNEYEFLIDNTEHHVPFRHKKKLAYPLGFYFGGQRTASQDMKIIID